MQTAMLNTSSRANIARLAGAGLFLVLTLKLLTSLSTPQTSTSASPWQPWSVSYFSSSTPTPNPPPDSFLLPGPDLDAHCARHRLAPFADRSRRRKIYALTLINTELEWLEIRMGTMASEIDYFVIVESALTFSDLAKPLHVRENWDRFAPWHDKMLLHTLNTTHPTPGGKFGDAWERERFNRDAMFSQVFAGLTGAAAPWPGDVILVGDVDELVRPEVLSMLRNCEIPKRTRLHTTIYYYSFQWISQGQGKGDWDHPDATFYDGKNTVLPQDLRDGGADVEVWDAGWHCSFCFDLLGEIVRKVQSYSHQEMNRPDVLDPKRILERVRNGEDMFGRAGSDCHRVERNVDVPPYLVENSERFAYVLDRDGEDGNFVDFWDVLGGEEK